MSAWKVVEKHRSDVLWRHLVTGQYSISDGTYPDHTDEGPYVYPLEQWKTDGWIKLQVFNVGTNYWSEVVTGRPMHMAFAKTVAEMEKIPEIKVRIDGLEFLHTVEGVVPA